MSESSKIALLNSLPTHLEKIIQPNELNKRQETPMVDVFAHSWQKSTPELITIFEDFYGGRLKISKHESKIKGKDGFLSMLHSMNKTISFASSFSTSNNFEYDLVVLMRYDLYFIGELNLLEIDPGTIWSPTWCSIGEKMEVSKPFRQILFHSKSLHSSSTKKIGARDEIMIGGIHLMGWYFNGMIDNFDMIWKRLKKLHRYKGVHGFLAFFAKDIGLIKSGSFQELDGLITKISFVLARDCTRIVLDEFGIPMNPNNLSTCDGRYFQRKPSIKTSNCTAIRNTY